MSRRDEILESIGNLPALPACASQVLEMLDQEDSGISEVIEVMQSDPALTVELLRLANSSYFAGPRKVASLRDAGVLFGKEKLRQLLLACAVFPMTKDPVRGYGLPGGVLLNHSIAVALGVEEAMRMQGAEVPAHAFTAGLLHDLGKIVLGTFIEIDPEPMRELCSEEKIPFDEAERQILGIDHTEVGAALLDMWNFPLPLVNAARWHHEPEKLDPFDPVTDCTHICDLISLESGLGAGFDGLNYIPSSKAIERAGMNSERIERLTCFMISEMQRMKADM